MRGKHNGNRARIDVMQNRGLSVKQIAEQLGIAVNTVHVHLHHIRKRSPSTSECQRRRIPSNEAAAGSNTKRMK